MQYFFVTEDSRDFRWQTELLLESLRLLNLESQTFVAICPGPGANGNPPCNNLVRFDNVGSKIRCPQFNKVEGLRKALEQGVLKQPFVVLDADMFLLRDIPRATGQIAAQVLPRLAWETVKPILGEHVDEWVGVGGTYQFNDVPNKTFENIYSTTYDLFKKVGNVPHLHNYGFTLGSIKSGLTFERTKYEMPLKNEDANCPIVHYRDGYHPHFSKEKIFDSIDFSFKMPLPFKKILEAPALNQPNVSLMQVLVRSWLTRNWSRIGELMF
jgi:hypothetical protein